MSSLDLFRKAFDGMRHSLEAGRVAHGYLIVGQPRGAALLLGESFLQLLYCREAQKPCGRCAQCLRIQRREHPDIVWIEPEMKSRRISIEKIRDAVVGLFTRKSYEGGWKAAIIANADRMTDEAANALLKTLEEPPGQSVILLLTDAPHHLRPTIVSRCQRILLGDQGSQNGEAPWRDAVLELLREGPARDWLAARKQAGRLKAILDEAKKRAEADVKEERRGLSDEGEAPSVGEAGREEMDARVAARVLAERSEILRFIQQWKRDVLLAVEGLGPELFFFPDEAEVIRAQAQSMTYAEALRDVQMIQRLAEQLEQHLPVEAVFSIGLLSAKD